LVNFLKKKRTAPNDELTIYLAEEVAIFTTDILLWWKVIY